MIAVESYLHLWYANFDPDGSFIRKVHTLRASIKDRALRQMSYASASSKSVEQEFEKWYNIESQIDRDAQIDIPSKLNSYLGELDDVKRDFKAALKIASRLADKRRIINYAITLVGNILDQGANTGYTSEAALAQIRTAKEKLEDTLPYFRQWKDYNSKEGKKVIQEAIETMEKGTAGYAFELADKLGFLTASQKGISSVHDLYINIGGGKDFSDTLRKEATEDPEFEKELNDLANMLSSNDSLSKGDQILFYHAQNGQGQLTLETKYAVFQDKNYTNIRNVVVVEKTFEQLGIFQEFGGENNLINLAAGLGHGATGFARQTMEKHGLKQTGIGFKATEPTNRSIRQGDLDLAWRAVRESARLLAIADGIAGDIRNNISMRPNYYVVRSRKSGEVHVIGVSTILDKIRRDLEANEIGSMGIKWNLQDENWKGKTREKYWMHNIGNFNPGKNPAAKKARSDMAWNPILTRIADEKVRISLDFATYFSKY